MTQATINQRLKFLIDSLGVSVRAFSEMINESPGNTQNYIGTRQLAPKHEYLAKILRHFSSVNAHWLLTGEGEPFLSDTTHSTTQTGNFNVTGHSNKQSIKGNVQANSGGKNTLNVNLDECKNALQDAQREVEFLQGQVKLQEAVIAAKEETITLLRASFNRPN